MPTSIPPNLSPVVQPAGPGSLTLLTSVLDATSNWLLLRYIYAALRPEIHDGPITKTAAVLAGSEGAMAEDRFEGLSVILISFLRPFELWREMGKKIGLDLPSLLAAPSDSASPRLIYIDAFSQIFLPPTSSSLPLPQAPHPKLHILPPLTTVFALESQILSFLPTTTAVDSPTHVLVVDAPDLLLASCAPSSTSSLPRPAADSGPNITPLTLSSLLLNLRSHPSIHSTILTLSADAPLLHPKSSITTNRGPRGWDGQSEITPLEIAHREFLVSIAHQATKVVQLRGLETGAASDVSGVLRISRGGAADSWDQRDAVDSEAVRGGGEGRKEEENEQEGEWLYQVKGDGSVRVWRRGE